MSSRQLILLSGSPGAGTSAIARAVASGKDATLISTRQGSAGEATMAIRAVTERANPFLADALASGPLLATADALLEVDMAIEAGGGVIVWDAGPIDPLLADLAVLDALPVLQGQASGPITALITGRMLPAESLEQARGLLDRVAVAMRRIGAPSTRVVVVERPDRDAIERVASARARLELLSMTLDHIVLNRVARAKDGASKRRSRSHRALADELAASGVPVHRVPRLEVSGFERKAAKRLRGLGSSSQRRPDLPLLEERDEGYAYRIPLRIGAGDGLRVGTLGHALVIEVRGLRRLLPLPAVLTRCSVAGAGMVGDVLIIRFDPDPRVWRQAS